MTRDAADSVGSRVTVCAGARARSISLIMAISLRGGTPATTSRTSIREPEEASSNRSLDTRHTLRDAWRADRICARRRHEGIEPPRLRHKTQLAHRKISCIMASRGRSPRFVHGSISHCQRTLQILSLEESQKRLKDPITFIHAAIASRPRAISRREAVEHHSRGRERPWGLSIERNGIQK